MRSAARVDKRASRSTRAELPQGTSREHVVRARADDRNRGRKQARVGRRGGLLLIVDIPGSADRDACMSLANEREQAISDRLCGIVDHPGVLRALSATALRDRGALSSRATLPERDCASVGVRVLPRPATGPPCPMFAPGSRPAATRALHPQRAVVLERGDPIGNGDEPRRAPAIVSHVSFTVLSASAACSGVSRPASLTTWS
jgi:hypothetical protein